MNLPKMPRPSGLSKSSQIKFGGYRHAKGAGDGDLYDMANLWSEDYPVLSTRGNRKLITTLDKPNGIFAKDGLYWVDGTGFYRDGELKGYVDDGLKTFAELGAYVVIFPDKKYYNVSEDEFGGLESVAVVSGASFGNGTIFGEKADANTLTVSDVDFNDYFKAGDAVSIEGCAVHAENDKPPLVVREISDDGHELRFYEYTFTLDESYKEVSAAGAVFGNGEAYGRAAKSNSLKMAGVDFTEYFKAGQRLEISGCSVHEGNNKTLTLLSISESRDTLYFEAYSFTLDGELGWDEAIPTPYTETGTITVKKVTPDYDSYTEPGEITLKRSVPDLDWLCSNDNRLWGCKGDEIFCSGLGNIFNWNWFEGVATDSYNVKVGDEGDFSGCVAYMGFTVFFKPNAIYKMFGTEPKNFQLSRSAATGVKQGAGRSVRVTNDVCYYLSNNGIIAYGGGIPQPIYEAFGGERFKTAVGGGDQKKYYASLQDERNSWSLFVYDANAQMWHREDGLEAVGFAFSENLYCLSADGALWAIGKTTAEIDGYETESDFEWFAEFGDITYGSPQKKGVTKLYIRLELAESAECSVWVKYDSVGDYIRVNEYNETVKRSFTLPLIPHRCDHFRIMIKGRGRCSIFSVTAEIYGGSNLRSAGGRQ